MSTEAFPSGIEVAVKGFMGLRSVVTAMPFWALIGETANTEMVIIFGC